MEFLGKRRNIHVIPLCVDIRVNVKSVNGQIVTVLIPLRVRLQAKSVFIYPILRQIEGRKVEEKEIVSNCDEVSQDPPHLSSVAAPEKPINPLRMRVVSRILHHPKRCWDKSFSRLCLITLIICIIIIGVTLFIVRSCGDVGLACTVSSTILTIFSLAVAIYSLGKADQINKQSMNAVAKIQLAINTIDANVNTLLSTTLNKFSVPQNQDNDEANGGTTVRQSGWQDAQSPESSDENKIN